MMHVEKNMVVYRFVLAIALTGLATLAGCRGHDADPVSSSDEFISFATIQADIIEPKCLSCHSDENPGGGYSFSSYRTILDSGSVVARKSDYSALYRSVANGRMPPGKPLSYDETRSIKNWIDNGAPETAPAKVEELEPKFGAAGAETAVSVQGFGFTKSTSVIFGSRFVASKITFKSSNELIVMTPFLPSGTYDITVRQADGTSSTKSRAFHAGVGGAGGMDITAVFPNKGPNGTVIQLTGNGFESDTTVTVGEVPCTNVSVQVPDRVTCSVPPVDLSQNVDVVAFTGDNQYRFSTGFTYTVSASYTDIRATILTTKCASCHTSNSAPSGMKVNGTYAELMTSGKIIPFDDQYSPLYRVASGIHPTTTPAVNYSLTPAEVLKIRNWIRNGAPDNTPPVVTTVVRNQGSTLGGTSVVITGTGFVSGLTADFGGSACTPVTVTGSTSISCLTGPHAPGVVNVTVINPVIAGSQQDPGVRTNAFTYALDPVITSISPGSVPSSNTANVTITGTNFATGANQVSFRFGDNLSVTGTATCASGTCTASVRPPTLPEGTYSVRVTNLSSTQFSNSGTFAYTAGVSPTVSSVQVKEPNPSLNYYPNPIVYTATTPDVRINGTGFLSGATVEIGGQIATQVVVVSATVITARPANNVTAGLQPVTVTNTNTLSGTLTNAFDFRTTPAINTLNPTSLPVSGGARFITLVGVGFVDGASITVDGVACTTVQINDSQNAICVAPNAPVAKNGVSVTLTNPADSNGVVKAASRGAFNLTMVIGTVTPSTGPIAGGTSITIAGDGFSGATVQVGGVTCTSPVVTQTQITCTTGANTAGVKNVVITNTGNVTGTKTNAFNYQ